MTFDVTTYVLTPVLIMAARMIDVSIGTVRIILVSRGREWQAAALGFIEVIVWLLAMTRVLANLGNVVSYIAFGVGFALGNVIGIRIEKKLALGMQIIRIIKPKRLESLQMLLRDEGYGVTTVDGRGGKGAIEIVYVVTERRHTADALALVDIHEPDAFVTVQDIYSAQRGIFAHNPIRRTLRRRNSP